MNDSGINRRILIVGYGNPLRADDRAGWAVIGRLSRRTAIRRHASTFALHSLTPELAERLSQVDLALFIDAADDRRPPGHIELIAVEPESDAPGSMAHHLTPGRLLGYAQRLFGRCPRAQLLTITGKDFSHSLELSAEVDAACDLLVEQLSRIVGAASQEEPCTNSP